MTESAIEVQGSAAQMIEQGLRVMKIENESQMQIAVQRPRSFEKIAKDALAELDTIPEFASKAYYSIPYKNDMGGTTYVEGPSVKAAMSLARRWGNCSNGARILEERPDRIIVEGVFVDYETNVRTLRQYSVPRGYYASKTKTYIPFKEDRQNMAIQSGMSKAVRNAILASLPVSLVEAYTKRAKGVAVKLLDGKKSTSPGRPEQRIASLREMFIKLGVTVAQWDEYLSGSSLEPGDLISHLLGLHTSISEGDRTVKEVFGETSLAKAIQAEGQVKAGEVFGDRK